MKLLSDYPHCWDYRRGIENDSTQLYRRNTGSLTVKSFNGKERHNQATLYFNQNISPCGGGRAWETLPYTNMGHWSEPTLKISIRHCLEKTKPLKAFDRDSYVYVVSHCTHTHTQQKPNLKNKWQICSHKIWQAKSKVEIGVIIITSLQALWEWNILYKDCLICKGN